MYATAAQKRSKRVIALATEFYASYSAERLQVRARHLLGAGQAFGSQHVALLAEAAFLALDWKSTLPATTLH